MVLKKYTITMDDQSMIIIDQAAVNAKRSRSNYLEVAGLAQANKEK